MFFAAMVLPLAALFAVGSVDELVAGLAEQSGEGSPLAGLSAASVVLFVIGTLGIGIGYPGQPHVVNR
jgi:sodium/proline symporter